MGEVTFGSEEIVEFARAMASRGARKLRGTSSPEEILGECWIAAARRLQNYRPNGMTPQRYADLFVHRVIGKEMALRSQFGAVQREGERGRSSVRPSLTPLQAPTGNGERLWSDVIGACDSAFERVEARHDVERVIGSLTPREVEVVRRLSEGDTAAEIGADLGVTRQRVEQLYHGVLARARRKALGRGVITRGSR